MPSLDTWTPGKQFLCLVFSAYGKGKTFGAGTFPRPNFLDFDKGIATLAGQDFRRKFPDVEPGDIQYEQFFEKDRDVRGICKTANAFKDAQRYIDAWMKPSGAQWTSFDGSKVDCHPDKFDTWIVDTGTTLSDAARAEGIIQAGAQKRSQTHAKALSAGIILMTDSDWGAERSLVEQFIDLLRGTNKHVVILCHEHTTTTDGGAVKERHPLFTGQSRTVVPSKVDEVYRLDMFRDGPNLVRRLITQPNGIDHVRTRYGIPDGTEWSWPAISACLENMRKARAASPATSTITAA